MSETIDSVMYKLEEVMQCCSDQPTSFDAMTMTRRWRRILEEYTASLQTRAPLEISAGVEAFKKRTAYWAPECFASDAHLEEMVESIMDAVLPVPS